VEWFTLRHKKLTKQNFTYGFYSAKKWKNLDEKFSGVGIRDSTLGENRFSMPQTLIIGKGPCKKCIKELPFRIIAHTIQVQLANPDHIAERLLLAG